MTVSTDPEDHDDPWVYLVAKILADEDEHWMALDWGMSVYANWHTFTPEEKRQYVEKLVQMADGEYDLPDEEPHE